MTCGRAAHADRAQAGLYTVSTYVHLEPIRSAEVVMYRVRAGSPHVPQGCGKACWRSPEDPRLDQEEHYQGSWTRTLQHWRIQPMYLLTCSSQRPSSLQYLRSSGRAVERHVGAAWI